MSVGKSGNIDTIYNIGKMDKKIEVNLQIEGSKTRTVIIPLVVEFLPSIE